MATGIDAEIQQLRAEVRFLRDRQDILDCVNRYGRGLDRLDAGLIEGAYHADAIDNHGPFVGPVPQFVKFAIGRLHQGRTAADVAAYGLRRFARRELGTCSNAKPAGCGAGALRFCARTHSEMGKRALAGVPLMAVRCWEAATL